jgi:hypothetical protein
MSATNVLTPLTPQPPSIPTVLVSDVLYVAARLAGIMPEAGTGLSPEESTDAFNAFNAMIDDWNSQRLMSRWIVRYLFEFNAGQQFYQIGPGAADWNVPRPERIETASVVITNSPTLPLEQVITPMTYENFQRISVKNVESTIPFAYYYDMQFPIGNVYFYPVPAGPVNQVAIYVWQLLGALQSYTQRVSLPPAYLRAVQYNLAIELAARFPLRQKLSPLTLKIAMESLRNIKSINTPIEDMTVDRAALQSAGGVYDYLSDTFRYPG